MNRGVRRFAQIAGPFLAAILLLACSKGGPSPSTTNRLPLVSSPAGPSPETTVAGSSPAADAATSPTPAGAAKPSDMAPDDQQQLTIRLAAEPEFLDPHRSELEQDLAVEHLLFRGLFTADQAGNPYPALAEQLPTRANGGISADGLTYTIKVKTGQKFSDGNALTANNMAYSVRRMLDPKLAAGDAGFAYAIKGAQEYNTALGSKDQPKTPSDADLQALRDAVGVSAPDDNTVQFVLKAPQASFLQRMALALAYPVEQAVVEQYGDKWTDPGNFVGNGPYTLKEWAAKDHITLVPNPNYTLDPKPYIKTLILRQIDDPNQALAAYKNNQFDITDVLPQQYQQIASSDTLKAQLKREPRPETRALEFNDSAQPFDNPRVRLAFAQAIDRNSLIKSVYGGVGVPGATWIPPGVAGHDDANAGLLKYDPAAAKQALAAAGFADGQGFPDVKVLIADTAFSHALFDFTQQQIKDNLNLTILADAVDGKTLASRYASGDFQLRFSGFIGDYPNADDWLPDLWTTNGSSNKTHYSNENFDHAVGGALAEADFTKQTVLWAAAEALLLQDAAVAPLSYGEEVQLWKPRVKGSIGSVFDLGWYGSDLFETVYIAK